jgi:cobalamin biosynthesis Co2+ chelatase CbiK
MMQALSDEYSRKIMLSTISAPKTVEELSKENSIPISTCYRRVHDLIRQGFLIVDKIVITNDGKKYETFSSSFKKFRIDLVETEFIIDAEINEERRDRLHNLWVALRSEVRN